MIGARRSTIEHNAQDLATDGAKTADALRKHAAQLRQQAADADGEDLFDVVDTLPTGTRPEHTNPPYTVWGL